MGSLLFKKDNQKVKCMLEYFWRPQFRRYSKILDNVKEGIIIDMGGAEGDLHNALVENTKSKVISVDFQGEPDIKQDLNHFPYKIKTEIADTIVAGEVIEHLEKPLEFLKECRRILKNKGRLVLTTPNMIGLQHIVSRNDKWLNRNDPHINSWNIEMIAYLVKKAGFAILKKELLNTYWSRNLFFRLICFLFPRIRPTIFIVAERV